MPYLSICRMMVLALVVWAMPALASPVTEQHTTSLDAGRFLEFLEGRWSPVSCQVGGETLPCRIASIEFTAVNDPPPRTMGQVQVQQFGLNESDNVEQLTEGYIRVRNTSTVHEASFTVDHEMRSLEEEFEGTYSGPYRGEFANPNHLVVGGGAGIIWTYEIRRSDDRLIQSMRVVASSAVLARFEYVRAN